MASLCRRRNLTSVSNFWEEAPISLFWAPNGHYESPEVHLEFPFILIGKSKALFYQANHAGTQIQVHRCGPEQGF